jgi:hypothetical protein
MAARAGHTFNEILTFKEHFREFGNAGLKQ